MIKVLFVCHGNKSRSIMAEGIFKKMVIDAGVQEAFIIESRAVSRESEGSLPHPEAIKRLEMIGVSWQNMISQKIQQIDFRLFDFIICMDDKNEIYLKKHAGIYRDKVYLVRDINLKTKKQNILNPVEPLEYDETFQKLNESLEEWLTMFKIAKLSKAIDVEDYRISPKPLFLTNEIWHRWNPEIQSYELTPHVPDEVLLSHKEFYDLE